MTLLYNAIMLAVDVASIWLVNRRKTLLVWAMVVACAGVVALSLGGLLAALLTSRGISYQLWGDGNPRSILRLWTDENHFGIFRLWAYGVFVHGVILSLGTAVVWRRTRPMLAVAAVLGAVGLIGIAADAFVIEPHWLEVSHRRIASPKIHHPLRIVVLADLQTDNIGAYERAVLRQVLEEKPDIILLAGDYIQAEWKDMPALRTELYDFLRDIKFTAPRGVFAIQGNVDVGLPDWQEIFAGLGVTTVSAWQSFDLGELQLTCLGLADSFNSRLNVANAQPDKFHIVLGHSPDFSLGKIEADLLLAGHTHGGQVQVPGLGPVITHSHVPHSWAAGMTELPGGGRLLVSRGIGVERGYAPPMRFLCRPELVVIDLVAAEEKDSG